MPGAAAQGTTSPSLATADGHFGRRGGVTHAAADPQLADFGDGSQRFAAEAQRVDGEQVIGRPNLARRVTGHGQRQLIGGDAATIVGHANKLHAALFQHNVDLAGRRVHGIFQQLLDHAGGALDHLSGGDLVDHARRQGLDSRQRAGTHAGHPDRLGSFQQTCFADDARIGSLPAARSHATMGNRRAELQLVFLDLAIQRAGADAQDPRRLFPVASGQLQRLLNRPALDLAQRLADQRQAVLPFDRIRRRNPTTDSSSIGRSSTSSVPSVSITTMLSIAFRSCRTLPGQS